MRRLSRPTPLGTSGLCAATGSSTTCYCAGASYLSTRVNSARFHNGVAAGGDEYFKVVEIGGNGVSTGWSGRTSGPDGVVANNNGYGRPLAGPVRSAVFK